MSLTSFPSTPTTTTTTNAAPDCSAFKFRHLVQNSQSYLRQVSKIFVNSNFISKNYTVLPPIPTCCRRHPVLLYRVVVTLSSYNNRGGGCYRSYLPYQQGCRYRRHVKFIICLLHRLVVLGGTLYTDTSYTETLLTCRYRRQGVLVLESQFWLFPITICRFRTYHCKHMYFNDNS